MKKIAIRCALIIFVITVIWTLLEHVMGYNTTNHAVGTITRQVTAYGYYGIIAYAIWKVRKAQGNLLSFKDGMMTGLYCSLTYSILVTVWFALYAEVINRQYQSTLLAYSRAKLESEGKTAAEVAEYLKLEKLTSGGSVASYLLLFVFMFLFGLMVSTIATFVMQRRRRRMQTV